MLEAQLEPAQGLPVEFSLPLSALLGQGKVVRLDPDGRTVTSLPESKLWWARVHRLDERTVKELREHQVPGVAIALLPAEDLPLLRQLSHMRWVRLAGSRIGDAVVPQLSQFSRLESLDLAACGLTPSGLRRLGALSSLSHLCISESEFSRLGDHEIETLSKLPLAQVLLERVSDGLEEDTLKAARESADRCVAVHERLRFDDLSLPRARFLRAQAYAGGAGYDHRLAIEECEQGLAFLSTYRGVADPEDVLELTFDMRELLVLLRSESGTPEAALAANAKSVARLEALIAEGAWEWTEALAEALAQRAELLWVRAELSQAMETAQRVIELYNGLIESEGESLKLELAEAHEQVGTILLDLKGLPEAAIEAHTRALAYALDSEDADEEGLGPLIEIQIRTNLAYAHVKHNAPELALAACALAAERLDSHPPEEVHEAMGFLELVRAHALALQGKAVGALAACDRAEPALRRAIEEGSPVTAAHVAECNRVRAVALASQGEFAGALSASTAAVETERRLTEQGYRVSELDLALALEVQARVHVAQGELAGARQAYAAAEAITARWVTERGTGFDEQLARIREAASRLGGT